MKDQAPLCSRCGKPIASMAGGSLTSWLFTQAQCRCKLPTTFTTTLEPPAAVELRTHESNDRLGQLINDRYEVLSLIGKGGMGSVYRVMDQELQTVCALKLINKEAPDKEALEKRLEQEAAAISALSHPNIVAVHQTGKTQDGSAFLAMDFIDGRNLEDVLKVEGPLEQQRALSLFIQIAKSIGHAHAQGVVHRDMKPSNVLITRDQSGAEVVKIVDFGIAQVSRGPTIDKTNLTQTGELIGSPLYMSPEQCYGERMSSRSDIYSIGCIMFETLTGHPPFEADNPVRVLFKHISEAPPNLPKELKIDQKLNRIVLRCLAKDPIKRYSSAAALLSDLERVRDGKPIEAATAAVVSQPLRGGGAKKVAVLTALIGAAVAWILAGGPATNSVLRLAAAGDINKQAHWQLALAQVDKSFSLPLAQSHAQSAVKLLQEFAQKTDDLGQAEKALNDMIAGEKEFALAPDDDTTKFIALGDRLVKAGKSQDAISVYTRAWRLQPTTPDSQAKDARILAELNRDQIPLLVIDSRKDRNEVLIKAETNMLQYISLCQVMAGDPSKESPYQDSLANNYNTLGWLYFREKRFDEELNTFKKPLELAAVKADPLKLGLRTYMVAVGYSHAERDAESIAWFKRAEAEGKASSDKCLEAVCCAFLARLSAEKSDFTESRRYISKALRLMQSSPTFYPNEEMLPAQVFRESARAYGIMHDTKAKEDTYRQGIAFLDAHKLQADNPSWTNLMDLYAKLLRSLPGRDTEAAQLEDRVKAIRNH